MKLLNVYLNHFPKYEKYGLTLQIRNTAFEMYGYRTWRKNRFIRKRALYIFKRAMLNGNMESIVSSLGHARKTGSLRHMLKLIRINYDNYHQLPKIYR